MDMKLSEFKTRVIDLSSTAKGIDTELIEDIQLHLYNAGYLFDEKQIDGIIGPITLAAFARFKKDNNLGYPYLLGETTARELLEHKERSSFFMPTAGVGWISSRFGMRTLNGRTRMHNGVDIAANSNTPCFSVTHGKVVAIKNFCKNGDFSCGGGWGNFVRIASHDKPLEFLYAHLNKVHKELVVGSEVRKGHLVGFVGNTGHSFGAHLHFEIIKNGVQVDPLRIMRVV
jgi:murein DD-endopeptidase MepM/ murein hydrolase activator NlpD